jgi:phenylacetate-CoA ligase
MGPGVAQEFVGDGAPTIWEDHFYPEIVDPVTGEALPDGEEGELVFTSLTKQALPIVRYRTRDLTRLLPGSMTPMRRMARITGRSDDMLIVRGVNVFPTQIEELVLRCPELAPHFLIEVARVDRMDTVTLRVEARGGIDSSAAGDSGRRLSALVKEMVGISVTTMVGAAGTLERSAGKAVRVVDHRKG